jgi:O-antigen/teichoic acid export membrane protein
MQRHTRLARNIFWQFVSRFGTQALMVLFTILLARGLGSSGFGEYAWIAAVIFVGNALTTFGTDMLLIREIANQDSLQRVPDALALQLILSAIFILLAWAAAPWLPNPGREAVLGVRIYSLALIPLAFTAIFTTVLRGKQLMHALTALNLGGAALLLAGGVVFLQSGVVSIARLAEILLLCQTTAAGMGALLCARLLPGFWHGWRVSKSAILNLARSSAQLGFLTLVGMLYQKLSVLMLAGIGGAGMTGWYSGTARVVEAAKTAHLAAFTALYPAMAEESLPEVRGTRSVQLPWQGTFRFTWLLLLAGAAAAALVLSLGAGPVMLLLFGTGFGPSAQALQVLVWILLPFTINTFFSLALLAQHCEKAVMRVQVFGLAALVLLSAWAIPHWGLLGACLASLLAESLQTVAYFLQARGIASNGEPVFKFFIPFRKGGAHGISAVFRKVR